MPCPVIWKKPAVRQISSSSAPTTSGSPEISTTGTYGTVIPPGTHVIQAVTGGRCPVQAPPPRNPAAILTQPLPPPSGNASAADMLTSGQHPAVPRRRARQREDDYGQSGSWPASR